MKTSVARFCDIPDGGAIGARLETSDGYRLLIVIRHGDAARVFLNSCPHLGVRLDWAPQRFLDRDGTHLICATHGARFELDSGYCVEGPCHGEALLRVPATLENGLVMVDPDAPLPRSLSDSCNRDEHGGRARSK